MVEGLLGVLGGWLFAMSLLAFFWWRREKKAQQRYAVSPGDLQKFIESEYALNLVQAIPAMIQQQAKMQAQELEWRLWRENFDSEVALLERLHSQKRTE